MSQKNNNIRDLMTSFNGTPKISAASKNIKKSEPIRDLPTMTKTVTKKVKQPTVAVDLGLEAPMAMTSSGKPKRVVKKLIPVQFICASGVMRCQPGEFGNKKYKVEVKYINEKGKKSYKHVLFGDWKKTYYGEKTSVGPEDEMERRKMLNRCLHDGNYLYGKFWEENVLLRQGCNSIDLAHLETVQSLQQRM
jgi:hypothetical protein